MLQRRLKIPHALDLVQPNIYIYIYLFNRQYFKNLKSKVFSQGLPWQSQWLNKTAYFHSRDTGSICTVGTLRSHKVHTAWAKKKSIFTKRTPGPDGFYKDSTQITEKNNSRIHTNSLRKQRKRRGYLINSFHNNSITMIPKPARSMTKKTINKLANRFKSSQQNTNKWIQP